MKTSIVRPDSGSTARFPHVFVGANERVFLKVVVHEIGGCRCRPCYLVLLDTALRVYGPSEICSSPSCPATSFFLKR